MTPISEIYRAKATELLRRADEPSVGANRAYCILMAAQWADLARRVEAEERGFEDYWLDD